MKTNRIKIIIPALIFAIIVSFLPSCKTANPCPEKPAIGNIGSMLNTGKDDYLPVAYGNLLYFTSIRAESSDKEQIYVTDFSTGEFSYPVIDSTLPLNKFPNTSSPAFYDDKKSGKKELYFAAMNPKSKVGNRDIFISVFDGNEWSEPKPLGFEISTKYYESHPAISPDGSFMIFSSDRPGGIGQTDLYITWRQANNTWSKPQNLGSQVNTPNSEIAPSIADDGSLYFASKGYSMKTGYDIIKAEKLGKGVWGKSKILPFPINTEFDDSGPTILKDKIVISSNRRGGCGGYDLYYFDLCGPVFVAGNVNSENTDIDVKGKVEIYFNNDGKNGDKYSETSVDESGNFISNIQPKRNYLVKYINECNPELTVEQNLYAPCSDSSTVKLLMNIKIPDDNQKLSLEKYKIPFFVSGYYQPNTIHNLQSLRNKFEYNLLGSNDSTKYIENPGPEYDKYAEDVESALNEVVTLILNSIDKMDDKCQGEDKKLYIKVYGFADPRPISSFARYDDMDVNDEDLQMKVARGDEMTNALLSKLRAYYTAKYIKDNLEKNEKYNAAIQNIVWKIEGRGIDESSTLTNEQKRKVYIKIDYK